MQTCGWKTAPKRLYTGYCRKTPIYWAGVKRHHLLPPKAASALVEEFNLSSGQIGQLVALLPPSKQNLAVGLPRLREAVADGDLLVVGQPLQTKGSPSRGGQVQESDLAPNETRAPSLGPHAEQGGQTVAPVTSDVPQNSPAQSLEECEQRLQAARMRLRTDGYKPKYTDEQILAQAETGELDDRFVVRLIETNYAGGDGFLGRSDATGRVKYWSTTFNQAENADTDPDTLAPLLGFTPNPDASYTLVVVDTQAPNAGQSLTLVPNHKNMAELSKGEIEGLSAEHVKEVMTPEYNEVYAEHMAVFEITDMDIQKEKDITRYANAAFTNSRDKSRFKTRAAIHKELGANQYHTGDGTTMNLLPSGGRCGVMETLTIDKNPQTLGTLERAGTAKRLSAKRL